MKQITGNGWKINRRDHYERTAEFSFLHEMLNEENGRTEFELSGLDPDEMEFMDADERREVLKDAGLDPDEYDF